jgi:bacteriorhodopsin
VNKSVFGSQSRYRGDMREYVRATLQGSIFVQTITFFANVYGLSLDLKPEDAVLHQALQLETFVQVIELIFYIWYASHVTEKLADVTRYRYYDWMITTPVMLFTTMLFYAYVYSKETEDEPMTMERFIEENKGTIVLVVIFNAFMLIFGYMAEVGVLSKLWSSVFGYAALLGSFGVIYKELVSKIPLVKQTIFWFMFFFWSLYGVAALLENHAKNISYNILDVFAKNFYGLYLTWYAYNLRVVKNED